MNIIEEKILRAVAAEKVSRATVLLAQRYLAGKDALAERPAPASVEHHEKVRRLEEREAEDTSIETLFLCRDRTAIDHRGRLACEACHHEKALEPHHLLMGAGGREDRPDVVMLICRDCHILDPRSAHRSPRAFAAKVVIPWAQAHGYQLPNRKEYRDG